MIDAHIPYRVVTDWKLSAESLEGLRAFIIPDAECLDDAALGVLEKWVDEGGRLVVTGPSGIREGTVGVFRRRTTSLLPPLTGIDVPRDLGSSIEAELTAPGVSLHRKLGEGTIVWTPDPVGMEYYLREKERSYRLSAIVHMVGRSALLDGHELSSKVGVFAWESEDKPTIFADLVNYDLDAESDAVTPAQDLRFRMRLPKGCDKVEATTLSPDEGTSASATVRDGWAVIHLPRLVHYASVKLAAR